MYQPSGNVVLPLSTHSPSIFWRTVPVAFPTRIGDPSSTITVLLQPHAQRITSAAQKSSIDIGRLNSLSLLKPSDESNDDACDDPLKHSSPARPSRR